MPTAITYTIGADVSRDYSNLNNFEADWGIGIGADLVVDDELWTAKIYNDDGLPIVEATGINLATLSTDATRYLIVTSASGNGAAGHPNDHTTRAATAPEIDNPALGALVKLTGTFIHLFEGDRHIDVRNLQFLATGNRGGFANASFTGTWENLIVRNTHSLANYLFLTYGAVHLRKILGIQSTSSRYTFGTGYGAATVYNCIAFNSAGAGTGYNDESGTAQVIFKNCAAFNFSNGFDNTLDVLSDYLAADDEVPSGANSFQTTGDAAAQFVNPVNSTAGDFRLKAGNELEGQGIAIAGLTEDIRGVTYLDPPAIGAAEKDPAGGGTTTHSPGIGVMGLAGLSVSHARTFAPGISTMSLAGLPVSHVPLTLHSPSEGAMALAGLPVAHARSFAPGPAVMALTGLEASHTGTTTHTPGIGIMSMLGFFTSIGNGANGTRSRWRRKTPLPMARTIARWLRPLVTAFQ